MDQAIKERWITALRSGEYEQGKGYLRLTDGDKDRYCCLGVLSELAVQHGVIEAPTWDTEYTEIALYGDDCDDVALPRPVVKWAGLEDPDPDFQDQDGDRRHLSFMNDNGRSFDEIADYIEEHF